MGGSYPATVNHSMVFHPMLGCTLDWKMDV